MTVATWQVRRAGIKRGLYGAMESLGRIRAGTRERDEVRLTDADQDLVDIPPIESPVSTHEFVENRPEGKEVGTRVGSLGVTPDAGDVEEEGGGIGGHGGPLLRGEQRDCCAPR